MLFLTFITGTIFGIISMGIISERVESKMGRGCQDVLRLF